MLWNHPETKLDLILWWGTQETREQQENVISLWNQTVLPLCQDCEMNIQAEEKMFIQKE